MSKWADELKKMEKEKEKKRGRKKGQFSDDCCQ